MKYFKILVKIPGPGMFITEIKVYIVIIALCEHSNCSVSTLYFQA